MKIYVVHQKGVHAYIIDSVHESRVDAINRAIDAALADHDVYHTWCIDVFDVGQPIGTDDPELIRVREPLSQPTGLVGWFPDGVPVGFKLDRELPGVHACPTCASANRGFRKFNDCQDDWHPNVPAGPVT